MVSELLLPLILAAAPTTPPVAAAPTLDQFEAHLAARDSATESLRLWCDARKLAEPAEIHAEHRRNAQASDPPEKMRGLLQLGDKEWLAMRHVHLACGKQVLSIAWNWYVPSRIPEAMNAELQASNVPFGKVVGPLGFRREPLETVRGALSPCPADTISSHRALLRLPDGKPLALVLECYTPANLR